MIGTILTIILLGFLFIPLVGVYIGVMKVIFDDNNQWQKENKGANIIRGKN